VIRRRKKREDEKEMQVLWISMQIIIIMNE
jgi:hypothetical protein